MDDEHYDTPWEFKNRAITAALRSQKETPSPAPASNQSAPTDENFFQGSSGAERLPPHTSERASSTVSPQSNGFHLEAHKVGNKKKCSPSNNPSSSSAQHLGKHNPVTTNGFVVIPQHHSVPTTSHQQQRRFSATAGGIRPQILFPAPPPHGLDRNRLSFDRIKPGAAPKYVNNHHANSPTTPSNDTQWPARGAYPLVGNFPSHPTLMEQFPLSSQEQNLPHSQSRRPVFDEASMVHEGMERAQAEQLLKPMEVGDFLLRRRSEGNLALSLRSLEGVLHIKLEMRDGLWILGEGPKFSSVGGMLRCYRKNELPVRGAEHVRLKSPLTTAEVALIVHATRRKSHSP